MCDVAIEFVRVQGLVGGRARFTLLEDGKPTGRSWAAYGRGMPSGDTPETNPDARRLWGNQVDLAPWFVPVEGFTPPAPGEHPRLFFRKGDIPALRRRAETEDGKAIVARLRALLAGDGERLPKTFNPTPPANHMKSPDLPVGETFTTWHGEGYGFLHVLTGEKKYADFAKQCVELAFAGRIDRDNRYGWAHPGTQFRAGSAVTAIAAAYDFCHDAWPADFREQVAREIQDYRKPCNDQSTDFVDLKLLAGRTGYPPSSNHYGAHMGVGSAILAIRGDPGTDTETLTARLRELEENIPRILAHGFGDRGFYAEGHHPGRISSNAGLSEFLMALRSAAGRDYISPRPNAQWMALQWVMLVVGDAGFPHHGPYGGDTLDGSGVSHSGDIAFGFGIVEPKYKPALLWTYEHCIKPSRPRYGANTYPHRAVQALLNWPIGAEAANPETVIPKAVVDTIHGFFMCRNRWKDGKDILVTLFKQAGPQGYHRVKSGGVMTIWGLGIRTGWKTRFLGPTEAYEAAADGSMVTSGGGSHLAVDLSGAGGAPLMVAALGPAFARDRLKPVNDKGVTTAMTEVKVGENAFLILTLQEGAAPKAVADGEGVKIGGQTVRFDGKRLRLSKWSK
jgi:hypothetical protein